MPFVMDCSVALSWYFADEISVRTQALRDRLVDESIHVPNLWPIEITNVVLAALRRNRITDDELPDLLGDLRELPDEIDRETDSMVWEASFQLATQFNLSIYDATYLELAGRKQLPLATLDKALARACQEANINVLT